ncbi:MAG: hypothetical protein ACREPA_03570 [Candidatus Dormibacteraceae bacterium]
MAAGLLIGFVLGAVVGAALASILLRRRYPTTELNRPAAGDIPLATLAPPDPVRGPGELSAGSARLTEELERRYQGRRATGSSEPSGKGAPKPGPEPGPGPGGAGTGRS